ncbi:MAG TPA: hypothetical protein VIB39_11705 [Candidatus Angelobacter sp.]|jgi:hypothetical protein
MADQAHNRSDRPDFDTYPDSPPVERIDRVREERQGHSTLEQRAAELGAAAGKVVYMVKRARATARNLPEHPALDRLGGLADEAKARAEHLRVVAAERARQLVQTARGKGTELATHARREGRRLRLQAKSNYHYTRRRAGEVAHDYPIHVALAAGAAGFLLGVGLRIWRSNRAHR